MKDVFIKSAEPADELGFDIGRIFERNATKGDIGIEIEVEGNKFPKREYKGNPAVDSGYIPKIWNYHKDGSLRGKDNAEYVLYKPIAFTEVADALADLWNMFTEYGSKLDVSNRTSVHIHLNVQRWHLDRLCTFMAMYFSLEEILTQWCGEHRVGNLFCLRAKDAPGIITKLKKFLVSNGEYPLSEGLHYAGFNAHALTKFGSIELRTLRGCQDPQTILHWIQILQRLYEKSADFSDPRLLMENFSGHGAISYLESLLGDKTDIVRDGVSMTTDEIKESIYDGIRMAQDLTYCRDWSLYKPVDTSKDPFGRLAKTPVGVSDGPGAYEGPADASSVFDEPGPWTLPTPKAKKTLHQILQEESAFQTAQSVKKTKKSAPGNPYSPGSHSWHTFNEIYGHPVQPAPATAVPSEYVNTELTAEYDAFFNEIDHHDNF